MAEKKGVGVQVQLDKYKDLKLHLDGFLKMENRFGGITGLIPGRGDVDVIRSISGLQA